MARRRIACDPARRVPYRPSPDTASRRIVACRIVRRRIACGTTCRRNASRPDPYRRSLCLCRVHGRASRTPVTRHVRPNSACSRRRYRRFTNVYSFAWPSRFMVAPSAARLRRTVGPPSGIKAHAGQKFRSPFLCVFLLNLHFRTRYGTLSSGISDR